MASDLVSARVPYAKKEAATSILKSLGLTASDLINDAFDFVLDHKELPSACIQKTESPEGFDAFVRSSTLSVDWDAPERNDESVIREGGLAVYESLA